MAISSPVDGVVHVAYVCARPDWLGIEHDKPMEVIRKANLSQYAPAASDDEPACPIFCFKPGKSIVRFNRVVSAAFPWFSFAYFC